MPEKLQLLPQRVGILCLLALLLPFARGAEIMDIKVDRDGRRYTLVSTMHFDAMPDQVFSVLIDYDELAGVSTTIKESRYLESDGDSRTLVYTRIGVCAFFFCTTVEKIEYLEFTRPVYIRTTAIPERSDVRYSRSEWQIPADDRGGTQVIFRLEFEPDFWIPPIFGPMVIKRILIADGASAVDLIEALAQKLPESAAISGT